jgi:hypothetical protein
VCGAWMRAQTMLSGKPPIIVVHGWNTDHPHTYMTYLGADA